MPEPLKFKDDEIIEDPISGEYARVVLTRGDKVTIHLLESDKTVTRADVELSPGWEGTGGATTINVAQAISFAVDERQETKSLFIDAEGHDPLKLRINEVSAELTNAILPNRSSFTVNTTDGKVFRVTVTEES